MYDWVTSSLAGSDCASRFLGSVQSYSPPGAFATSMTPSLPIGARALRARLHQPDVERYLPSAALRTKRKTRDACSCSRLCAHGHNPHTRNGHTRVRASRTSRTPQTPFRQTQAGVCHAALALHKTTASTDRLIQHRLTRPPRHIAWLCRHALHRPAQASSGPISALQKIHSKAWISSSIEHHFVDLELFSIQSYGFC